MPAVDQDTIEKEDQAFREYLFRNGWDISKMGNEDNRPERSELEDITRDKQ